MSKLVDWLKECGMENAVPVSVVFQSDKTRFATIGALYTGKFGTQMLYVLGSRSELPRTLQKADGFCDTGQRDMGQHFWYLAGYSPDTLDLNGRHFNPFGHNMIFSYTDRETFLAITSDRKRELRVYDLLIT